MTKGVVIVFARAPRLGTVKRRLARGIGQRAALRFHAGSLHRLLRELAREGRVRTILALTPDHAHVRLPVPRGRIDVVGQGRGDLGQRMDRAFRRFPHRNVVLMGSDIPQAGAADARAALRALGTVRAVFGPARDGGYWLVALSPLRPAHPFAAVRWSTEHALADTLENFRGRRVARLRPLSDVDTAADYRRLVTAPG